LDREAGTTLTPLRCFGKSVKGGATLPELPPPFREEEFQAVDTTDKEEIRRYFRPFVVRLHSFLNETSCLSDIQVIRHRKNPQITSSQAFDEGYFSTQPQHWYTHNAGGRNEAQFNIGMFPDYLRVGLGFEFRKAAHGDPEAVQEAYGQFTEVLRQHRQVFERLAQDNTLMVEWVPKRTTDISYVRTQGVLKWLIKPSKVPDWIFVGRLLGRREDAEILEDQNQLKEVMESVFRGLKNLWEESVDSSNKYSS
jgi:hypothetical protein